MNFKKFVASLAVSTMLVGSQAAISNADYTGEKSPKTEVSQKANSDGVVKTVLNCIPGLFGIYNELLHLYFGFNKVAKVGPLNLPHGVIFSGKNVSPFFTIVFDGSCIVYSVSRFLV